jgi:putative flavoprotein involved in K+ transport
MTGTTERHHVDTVVVGASQAGLAAGYHLKRRGRPFVMLDAHDQVGDAWRNRWDSLRLFTTARYDGLPGMPFPAPRASYPNKDDVADYLQAYAEQFKLPVRTGCRVHRVSRHGHSFDVVADGITLTADNVVVATGACSTPTVPDIAERLDADVHQLHSSAYRGPAQLRDGGVLVVGAGNSGAEIALEASRDHPTWLSGRHPGQEPTSAGSPADRLLMPVIWLVASRLLRVTNPIGRRVRRQFLEPPRGIPLGRVRQEDIRAAGIERVPRTVGVHEGRPELEDGRILTVANVIWCTGFHLDFSWIDLPVVDQYGYPASYRGIVTSQPGLYFLGLPFLYSLTSALLGGVGRDAAYVVDHIAGRETSARTESRSAGTARSVA